MTINVFQTGSGHGMSFLMIVKSFLRQVDKNSGVPEEEGGVWGSQGGDRGLEFSRRRKGQTFCSLSPELMIAQQNNSSCSRICSALNSVPMII